MCKHTLDALDRGIIKFLSNDGRMSFAEIATHLNVTEKTIRSRYKNLVDLNILEVVGVVDPSALGIKSGAIIQVKVNPNAMESVIKQLQAFREVRYITMTTGEYQLLFQINVENQEGLAQMVKNVNAIEGISATNFIVQLEVYKNSFDYFLGEDNEV
ncbi:Lrp/AsnC family transcriptional regulator [Falsibacillus albus]|uniref:Lrp/AsnC family transcriptional regulator n=1 Tax=Falsibacillus albus TaxID=2478915 RepID=UPI001F215DA2|nr:AsnC family transcriptional regulator [Falsibacillus albus]